MTAPIARIEPLQVLRALAAILIMAKHALYEVDLISPIDFNYGDYKHYTIGIDIFFVLSGFIMIYISHGQTGFATAKDFFLKRVLRIVPTYWFYTFLLAGVALVAPQLLGKAEFIPLDFIKSLFFIPYFNSAGDLQPFLANGWSLNYEMYFYLVFALCLVLPVRFSLVALSIYFIGSVATEFWGIPSDVFARFYGSRIVLEFLVGACIGYLFLRNIRLPALFFYIGLVFTALSVLALFYTKTIEAHGYHYQKDVIAIIMVVLLVLPKKSEHFRMPKWAVLIGDSSYTLYLAHPFAIGAITQLVLLADMQGIIHPWVIFMTIFAVSIIGSILAYKIIEKPLLSFTKGLVYKETPKA